MFLEPTCTSECLITETKTHFTTFINLQTYNFFLAFLKENILWIITVSRVLPKIHSTNASGDGGLVLQTSTVVQTEDSLSLKKEIDFDFSSKLVRTKIWQKPSSWPSRVGLPHPSQKACAFPPVTQSRFPLGPEPCAPQSQPDLKGEKKKKGGRCGHQTWKISVPESCRVKVP